MTLRCCLDCGTPEVRTATGTNLEPISGLCLPCLSKAAKRVQEQIATSNQTLFLDYKAAQAGKDE